MERLDSLDFIRGSDLFRYRFVKIATLFGIIDKGAKTGRGAIDRVMNFYDGSVVMEEVARELGKNYFDVESVQEFARGVRAGTIKIDFKYATGSPLTREIIQSAYSYSELLSPEFGKENAVERLKEKLSKESLLMVCSFCGYAFEEKMDFDGDKSIKCRKCGSPMVVIYDDEKTAVINRRIEGKPLNRRDAKVYTSVVKEAGLIKEYGNRAVIALSVYGIGVDTAARVLRMLRRDYKEFFVDVLEEQKKFIKNRKFWNG
jgi:Lhr-like helicases